MHRHFRNGFAVALAGLMLAGCGAAFKLSRYTTNESLYRAAILEFQRKSWDNAVQAFERLTLELPARDTLLPLAHWYLARSHSERGEHLLAAQAFNRMAESFATDTLADDAAFQSARSYQKLWRKPVLDAQYGGEALAQYQLLLSLYPDSPLADEANREILRLQEWFATKDYENAMYYFRQKAFDSALIYFRDIVRLYPQTARAREAYLRMAESYDAIRWKDDKDEVCRTLKEKYPNDREVGTICGGTPVADTTKRPPN